MDEECYKKLTGVLICPKSKEPLVYHKELNAFVNKDNNVIYDIKEGIPALLEEECKTFEDSKKKVESTPSDEEIM